MPLQTEHVFSELVGRRLVYLTVGDVPRMMVDQRLRIHFCRVGALRGTVSPDGTQPRLLLH